jgi:GrpB-like predicted nucleotidyltransferase (UPF0157 family)
MKRPIVLVAHDARWAGLFAAEQAAILGACGGLIRAVHHVGSTSIPGIAAKPVIDIMPVLARHEDGFACIEAMQGLGYESRGEAGIRDRHYFRKGDPRSHHVHMFAEGHPEIGRHLRFRDFLRTHPDEARAYEALKRELAARFIDDVGAYSDAKDDFCNRIDRLALAEAR